MSASTASDIHVFEVHGRKLAFNGSTYGVAVLNDNAYQAFRKAIDGKPLDEGEQAICSGIMASLGENGENHNLSSSSHNAPPQITVPLSSLSLLITSYCNMRCSYCFNHQGAYKFKKRQIMSIETAKNAVDFLLSKCDRQCGVSFFGGEPLTQFPLIMKTVEYAEKLAHSQGIRISFHVTTNGTLITPEIARFLKSHDFSVIISLDGDEESHDSHRRFANGTGSYQIALRGAKRLVEEFGSQQKITIRSTYTRQQTSFSNWFVHLVKHGFENISIEHAVGDEMDKYAIRPEDIPAVLEEYGLLADAYQKVKSVSPQVQFFHFEKHIRDLVQHRTTNRPCGAANGYMVVTPDGGIYPCHRIVTDEYRLGNVNEILNGGVDLNQAIRHTFSNAITLNRSDCQTCWARFMCGGSCYADSIQTKHNMTEHDDVHCRLFKRRAELVIGLVAEQPLAKYHTDSTFDKTDFFYPTSCPSRCECQCQTKGDD